MPTLLVVAGFRFFMVMADCTEPPHVHVAGGRGSAKLWLRPAVEVAATRGYTASELRTVERVVRARREELIRRWETECREATG